MLHRVGIGVPRTTVGLAGTVGRTGAGRRVFPLVCPVSVLLAMKLTKVGAGFSSMVSV
jgi:hypothetical protein